MLRSAFPDFQVTADDLIAEGDKVVARCSIRGKHEGNSLGIEATGAMVDFDGIGIARVKDGMLCF